MFELYLHFNDHCSSFHKSQDKGQPECLSVNHQMQKRTSFMMDRKLNYKVSMILSSILSIHIKCLAPKWCGKTNIWACLSTSLA